MDDLNGLEFMQSVNGSVPDGVYEKDTGFFFCCRSDGDVETPIVLPKDQPFVLFMANGSTECQSVRGKLLLTSSYCSSWHVYSKFFIRLRDCYVGYSLNKTNQRTITNSFKKRIKLNISSKEIVLSSFVIDKNSSQTVRHSFIVVYVVFIVFWCFCCCFFFLNCDLFT